MPPVLTDIDGFFSAKEAAGIDRTVIVNALMTPPGAPPDYAVPMEEVRSWNEFACGLVDSHPGRIAAFTGIDPFGRPDMLAELERAMQDGRFSGICVLASADGEFLDSPQAADFWALASQLGVPVFIHPPSTPGAGAGLKDPRLLEYAGRATDVGLSVASMIFAGLFERYPSLKIIASAGGGGLAMLAGRLDVAARYGSGQAGPPGRSGVGSKIEPLPCPPSHYLRRVYADTCTYSRASLLCNIEVFGVDHVLFGTDFPPVNVPAELTLDVIDSLPITEEAREQILGGNAAQLLNLERA